MHVIWYKIPKLWTHLFGDAFLSPWYLGLGDMLGRAMLSTEMPLDKIAAAMATGPGVFYAAAPSSSYNFVLLLLM